MTERQIDMEAPIAPHVRSANRGAAMMSVLLFALLILTLTVGVMSLVRGDLAAGIRQQQAVRVFNIAEAGIHFAIAKLQAAGADTYAGETITIADGATPIGSAAVVVDCLLPALEDPPCAVSGPAFRRITSTGSLVVAGPVRVVTAIVEGSTSATSNYAVCAYDGLTVDQQVTIYGSVGSNGNISLQGPGGANRSAVCDSTPGGLGGRCGTPNPIPPTPFSASVYAVGTITCSQGCMNQVEGTIAPNQPAGSICPAVALSPPSPPGTTDLTVPLGSTIIADPAVNYGDVALASTPGNPNPCPVLPAQRATLVLDSGLDPTATITFRMATLDVGKCARLEIRGVGKVELWVLEPTASSLNAAQKAIFGTTSLIVGSEVPVEGSRLTINVVSTNASAVFINQSGLVAGTFIVPAGGFHLNQAQITNGAILAQSVAFDQGTTFTWDPRSRIGNNTYANFNIMRAWKDQ
ncbi:MAG: hypothetical protein ACREN5_16235 [Gemmatimonadales bacterium]